MSPYSTLRRKLLNWFDRNQRDLPWRRDRDAYRIWVSEVMLQQTTVAAVVPYFERFLTAFPTVTDLAAADEQEVLKLWAGLGYYRRARHLHRAAKTLVQHYNGALPNDPEVWTALPGVGRYILGAVLSQAFDRRLPIVEANSLRVLCRLFGYRGDPRSGEGQRWLWTTASELLPRKRVGDFNQALMELGALVCTPTTPECGLCPLATACISKRDGLHSIVPQRAERPAIVAVEEVAVVVYRRGKVLLAQRPADASRWASFWEFPHTELRDDEPHASAVERLLASIGLTADVGGEVLTVKHGVTRFAIRLVAVDSQWRAGSFESQFYARGEWIAPSALSDYPIASAQRKLAAVVAAGSRQRRLF
ncbi:MAG: A/G-specific adenine glycosylase [Gemmataceae bacterium]